MSQKQPNPMPAGATRPAAPPPPPRPTRHGVFHDFAAGMEAAAQLCDEEVASAKKLLAESSGRAMRVIAIRDCAEALASTIRAFARDGDWLKEAASRRDHASKCAAWHGLRCDCHAQGRAETVEDALRERDDQMADETMRVLGLDNPEAIRKAADALAIGNSPLNPCRDVLGGALAMRVRQSDLYDDLDTTERGECDALIAHQREINKNDDGPAVVARALADPQVVLSQFHVQEKP
jgi:hypothetical protein